MYYVIPITTATLDIIEVLNDGVRPELDPVESFYVYQGPDKPAEIITGDDYDNKLQWEMPQTHTKIIAFDKQ